MAGERGAGQHLISVRDRTGVLTYQGKVVARLDRVTGDLNPRGLSLRAHLLDTPRHYLWSTTGGSGFQLDFGMNHPDAATHRRGRMAADKVRVKVLDREAGTVQITAPAVRPSTYDEPLPTTPDGSGRGSRAVRETTSNGTPQAARGAGAPNDRHQRPRVGDRRDDPGNHPWWMEAMGRGH